MALKRDGINIELYIMIIPVWHNCTRRWVIHRYRVRVMDARIITNSVFGALARSQNYSVHVCVCV